MWRVAWSCWALIGGACVSSGTWSSYAELERELAQRAPRVARGDAAGCDALANEVANEFPSVRAAEGRARAALARGRSEGALPAPELTLEVWDFPIGDPQLADREGMYMAGLSQEFPPAGALDARARAAAEEARETLAELSDRERGLYARAFESCVEWSAASSTARALEEAIAHAERMREMLLGQIRAAGRTSIADVARVEGEIARLRRMRVQAQAQSVRASARLRAWLGRLPETPPSIEVPARSGTVGRAVATALQRRGAIRAAQSRALAAAARIDAAEAQASVPTFRVRATYMQTPSARPGLGAEIGMTLPWLWSGEGAAREAARAERDAALAELEATEREVRGDVMAAAAALDAALSALRELREHERPAAERALEAVIARIGTGDVDLSAWLDASHAVRELSVEETRLLGEAARARAELESAVGAR